MRERQWMCVYAHKCVRQEQRGRRQQTSTQMLTVVTSEVMSRSGEGKGEVCLFHRLMGLDVFKRSSISELLVQLRFTLKNASVGGEHMDTAGSTAGGRWGI